jgi:3',5'-cyclic AMP phosphodiesterase CpdA
LLRHVLLQFIGDEIEAVFGAPVPEPRHADHAVAAGLEMRRRLAAWNVYGHVDTSAFLACAVDHILHLDPRPDVVLGTGDLVDGGTPAEYARLRHLLSPLPWARPAGGAGRGDETQGSGARKVVCVS